MRQFRNLTDGKKLLKILVIALGFGLLSAAVSSIPTRSAAASGSAPVTVVNTPLPVNGTVQAQQGGPWNVGISGTPIVNVASLPPVSLGGNVNAAVSNPVGNAGPVPLIIQDSANSTRTAFDVTGTCSFNGTAGCSITPLLSVPGGDIAEIESVSGGCSNGPGESLSDTHIVFTGSSSLSYSFFIPTQIPDAPGPDGVFAQNLRAYAFGGTNGTTINFESRSTGTNSNVCLVAISGHLVKQ
jgi:hypothetical protein